MKSLWQCIWVLPHSTFKSIPHGKAAKIPKCCPRNFVINTEVGWDVFTINNVIALSFLFYSLFFMDTCTVAYVGLYN